VRLGGAPCLAGPANQFISASFRLKRMSTLLAEKILRNRPFGFSLDSSFA